MVRPPENTLTPKEQAEENSKLLARHGYSGAEFEAMPVQEANELIARLQRWDAFAPPVKRSTSPLPADVPLIETADELVEWMRNRKGTRRCCYFIGDLSTFNYEASRRLTELQRRADKANRTKPRPAKESTEMDTIQKRQERIRMARYFGEKDLLLLSQTRLGSGKFAYIATRRSKP